MDELDKYVAYYRHECGFIERMGPITDFFWFPQEMFRYEEKLVGWPETEVYWYYKYGESFGIAKLVD
jgi:hypothetical protein